MVLHSELQDRRHTLQLQGVRQAQHSRSCSALSGQCLLSFCDSNGPILFEQLQIQGVRWLAASGAVTCAIGFGGASRAEISKGTFTDNEIGSLLRVFGNSSVTISGTRVLNGTGGITAGEFQPLVELGMLCSQAPGSGSRNFSEPMPAVVDAEQVTVRSHLHVFMLHHALSNFWWQMMQHGMADAACCTLKQHSFL